MQNVDVTTTAVRDRDTEQSPQGHAIQKYKHYTKQNNQAFYILFWAITRMHKILCVPAIRHPFTAFFGNRLATFEPQGLIRTIRTPNDSNTPSIFFILVSFMFRRMANAREIASFVIARGV